MPDDDVIICDAFYYRFPIDKVDLKKFELRGRDDDDDARYVASSLKRCTTTHNLLGNCGSDDILNRRKQWYSACDMLRSSIISLFSKW